MTIAPFVPPAFLTSLPPQIWSGAQGMPVLPYLPGQEVSVAKAPKWSTQVIRSASGRERRTSYWSYPLWEFQLSYGVVRHRPTNDELAVLWEFFNALGGQFGAFLFVDPTDCQIPSPTPQVFGVGDGVTTAFQLTRSINSFVEPVYAVFAPTILNNGTSIGSNFLPNGVASIPVAPAAGHTLSWYGYFYFGCRFLQDDLTFEQIVSQLWSGRGLKFTSLRV